MTLVTSALLYAVVCRGGGSMDRDRKRLKKLVRWASYVLDCPLDSIEALGERGDVSQADVNHGQHLSPPAPDCEALSC